LSAVAANSLLLGLEALDPLLLFLVLLILVELLVFFFELTQLLIPNVVGKVPDLNEGLHEGGFGPIPALNPFLSGQGLELGP
jgi:hypothetical protein